jgi:NAD(P)-dependent dehydrogenase (short-subunit alcohol dehydrogenase family)
MSAPDISLARLVDLSGKVAIVTGAGQGLGNEIARRLAEAGAAVVVNDLDQTLADGAVTELRAAGRQAIAVPGDVASRADVEATVATTVDAFGRVDILVNNAGIWPTMPFLEADEAVWRKTLEVNLVGQLLCSQAVARRLLEQGEGGSIVNIASMAAVVVHPDSLVAYSASKAGVVNATKTLAKLLAPNAIRVNVVLPGGMETPGVLGTPRRGGADIPLGRRAHPDEVARVALFLASDLACYVTGVELLVDGGVALL